MTEQSKAIAAQAELHHQYFLGLQLMVAVEEPRQVVFDWIFRLFRRQHEEKFLSSFDKLGLDGLPHAVACATYHVLSNSIGGVAVEYMPESETKAWVRFRYPRWMYAGPAICGIPVEASRGFLYGWYAQNGVSLRNPRLGFVCVSEDVTGQFGLCGYFKEYDRDRSATHKLIVVALSVTAAGFLLFGRYPHIEKLLIWLVVVMSASFVGSIVITRPDLGEMINLLMT